MFIEIHMLQNFAPSNLNRDDTNTPKTCVFGGYRRARISSQCLKRSIRRHPAFKAAVESHQGSVGVRTKRLFDRLVDGLTTRGHAGPVAAHIAQNALRGLSFKLDSKESKQTGQTMKLTQYLLFLGEREIKKLIDVADNHAQALASIPTDETPTTETEKKSSGAKAKREQRAAIPEPIQKDLAGVFGPAYAADVAMFGRMVADGKNLNVDAACQVAHAISTNEVEMEMDFYTAVDDLKAEDRDEDAGSGMLGTVEYNSATYYRYALVNVDKLAENLAHDVEQVVGAIGGFLEASALAIPSGKQNSMAAHNPPAYIRVLAREGGAPWSLANAFLTPVRPGRKDGEDLLTRSAANLGAYFEKLKRAYGSAGILQDLTCTTLDMVENPVGLQDLITQVVETVQSRLTAQEAA